MSKNVNAEIIVSRLGEPDQVADAAVVAYERRTFLGRHPSAKFWVFGVSPIASMALFFVLACLGVVAFGSICESCGVRLADEKHLGGIDPAALSWAFSLVTTILPAALLTFAYCLFAKRLDVGRKWMLASSAALALIAMLPIQSILISDMPGKSLWSIGLCFPPSLLQCIQLFVPLAIGLWFVRHNGRQTSHNEPLRMAA